MDLDLYSTPRARLIRDDDGVNWCTLRGLLTKRFRVMPEKPLTMQHAAGLLGLSLADLCELMDRELSVVRARQLQTQADVPMARKAGG